MLALSKQPQKLYNANIVSCWIAYSVPSVHQWQLQLAVWVVCFSDSAFLFVFVKQKSFYFLSPISTTGRNYRTMAFKYNHCPCATSFLYGSSVIKRGDNLGVDDGSIILCRFHLNLPMLPHWMLSEMKHLQYTGRWEPFPVNHWPILMWKSSLLLFWWLPAFLCLLKKRKRKKDHQYMVYTLWALLNFAVSCPLLLYCN